MLLIYVVSTQFLFYVMVSLTDLDPSLVMFVIAARRMQVLFSFNVSLSARCRDPVLDGRHLDRKCNVLPPNCTV